MSTATEITRLQTARNTIRDKLIELGLATSTAKLDALATAVDGIENKGAISASVQEGDTYTIPKGYHNGSGTVSGVAGGGNYSLQSKTVTPTKSQQSVTPDQGFYGLSDVTVNPIPEAYQNVSAVTAAAGDVLANKVIVDATGATKTGTMPNNGAVEKTLDTNTTQYIIPKGYHNGQGIVEVSLEEKTVTPERTLKVVSPTAGKVLGSVTVNAIPKTYQDALETYNNIIEESTAKLGASAEKILNGEYAYVGDENANTVVKVVGTMPNNGAVAATIDGLTNTSYTIPKGYHNGSGTVSLTNDIETALAAI